MCTFRFTAPVLSHDLNIFDRIFHTLISIYLAYQKRWNEMGKKPNGMGQAIKMNKKNKRKFPEREREKTEITERSNSS